MDAKAFNEKLIEALKEGLSRILGELVAQVVLFSITTESGIRLEELSEKVPDIHQAFVKILGVSGATLVESVVAKEFCCRLLQEYNPNLSLSETIEKARCKFLSKPSTGR